MAARTLTQADSGKSIVVAPGDLITIRLPENPTTGYRWAVDKADTAAVSLQNEDFTPPAGGGVGAGGEKTVTFEAKKAGSAEITLKRWRDWEGDASITDRFGVTVQVRGD